MWSMNTNKYLGAVIVVAWLVLVVDVVGDWLIPPVETVQSATAAPAAGDKATAAAPAQQAAAPAQSLPMLLASASVDKGKKVAKKCIACHTFKKGGKNKIGPNLFATIGRNRASSGGFKYSGALKKMGGTWGYDDLDKFLAKPKAFVPGTEMSFAGVKRAGDRAALILFMRGFADQPAPLP